MCRYIKSYKLDCDCGLSYIGQTKRNIGVRVKEHIADIKNGHVSKSAVCEHTVDKPSHYIRFDKLQTLAKENRYIPRMTHERIEIQKHPNFNSEDGWKFYTTWDPLKKSLKSQTGMMVTRRRDTVSLFCRNLGKYARQLRNRWR